MLKIGEFSKLSRVSVRMLRHYDEIGLLKPAETDRFTDYRYYREDQLPTAGRIAALKEMRLTLVVRRFAHAQRNKVPSESRGFMVYSISINRDLRR